MVLPHMEEKRLTNVEQIELGNPEGNNRAL
jgi:hypothetical protein